MSRDREYPISPTCWSLLTSVSLLHPFRKILRLVKHTLASVSGVRDQEMALLDEMLAACAREASNKSLELIFSSHLFYQNRQERFISSLAGRVHHTWRFGVRQAWFMVLRRGDAEP